MLAGNNTGSVCLGEIAEDRFQLVRRNSYAGVRDRKRPERRRSGKRTNAHHANSHHCNLTVADISSLYSNRRG